MNYSHDKTSGEGITETAFVDGMTDRMPRLMHAVMRYERNELSSGVLNLPQFAVLNTLWREGPLPMHTIADAMQLIPSHVTGIMDRLVAHRMARRAADARDRRVVLAEITDRGRAVIERIRSEKRKTMQRVHDELTPEERRVLLAVMDKLVEHFEQPAPENGGEPKP